MYVIDKQKALRCDCIYNIEHRDLEKRVSGVYLIYYNILTHTDDATPDWLSRCKSIQHFQDKPPERKT